MYLLTFETSIIDFKTVVLSIDIVILILTMFSFIFFLFMHSILGRKEMENFLKIHKQKASFVVVRTRINNERAKIKKRLESEKRKFGIP